MTAVVEHIVEDIVQIKTLDQIQKPIEDWVDVYMGYLAPHKSRQQTIPEITEIEDTDTEYLTTNETSEKDEKSIEGDGNKSDDSNSSIHP